MGSLMAQMRLRREQQLECDVRWGRRVVEEFMGLIVIWVYRCTEGFCSALMESMVLQSLSRPIFEEILGGMGAIVYLGDVLDCLFLNF